MRTALTPGRHARPLLIAALILGLAACGDDDTAPSASDPDTSTDTGTASTVPGTSVPGMTLPGTSVPASQGIDHPVGADEVVVRIAYEGGFVPVEYAFRNLPVLLVTGDGRVLTQGPMIEIYPGPLLPNVLSRSVTEAGVQELLAMAVDHGLLAEREYANPTNIADAPDTVVEISANGTTFVHRAYALGLGGDGTETDADRQALADFVAAATGDWLYGGNTELGAEQPFVPDSYLIRAFELGDIGATDIPPTYVDWPAEVSVRLADAVECAKVPAAEVAELFESANQLTYFVDAGVDYQVAVKPLIPGDSC